MIPFDFVYCRPDTLKEAGEAFLQLQAEGKSPVYYAGGSEIITRSRAGSLRPGALVDIKSIPECTVLKKEEDGLTIGSACTLNRIKESKLFPLMALCCGRIADHTNQCRITLGGNLCGTIRYRETSLPLLLSDAALTLFGSGGLRREAFCSVFSGQMQLLPGEFIVQLRIPGWALEAPHFHVKRTANEKIDYPLVSVAALLHGGRLRAAFSGVCPSPFRSEPMEDALNDPSLCVAGRAEKAVGLLPEPACSDAESSAEYRRFVFENTLRALLEEIADGQV